MPAEIPGATHSILRLNERVSQSWPQWVSPGPASAFPVIPWTTPLRRSNASGNPSSTEPGRASHLSLFVDRHDVEHRVEARDLKKAPDRRRRSEDREPTARVEQPFVLGHDHTEAGRIHERDLGKVQNHVLHILYFEIG